MQRTDTTVFTSAQNVCFQISSLAELSELNSHYKELQRLVLANNSLVSLAGLETSWLPRTGLVSLDVRSNKIQVVVSRKKI